MSWLLIFGEQPERFTHSRPFVVSDLSDLLTLLFKNEGMSESLVLKKTLQKLIKNKHRNTILLKHFWANCSFFVRERAPWANCSWSLFIMSDLSDLLTVAHLCEAIWANCSQSLIKMSDFEQMSKLPTLDFRSPNSKCQHACCMHQFICIKVFIFKQSGDLNINIFLWKLAWSFLLH